MSWSVFEHAGQFVAESKASGTATAKMSGWGA